jgi:dTDP-4-amino-4,6-dideoxygalactose transaminase
VESNHAYFPILIGDGYPLQRDELYSLLKEMGINSRRYFYPLISDFPMYRGLPSADPAGLPVAHDAARRVICLPMFPALQDAEVDRIASTVSNIAAMRAAA